MELDAIILIGLLHPDPKWQTLPVFFYMWIVVLSFWHLCFHKSPNKGLDANKGPGMKKKGYSKEK